MASTPLGPRRAVFALLGAIAFAAALTLLVLGMVFSPLPAVASGKPAPFGPPLAPHTVLVLVDGLRHDIAHDRARMPHLAARLEAYGEAVLWASPVSMTSAAVLLMGTGVRGDLEQIIANESHEPTPFDSIFAALGEARAPIATVGDHVWPSLFPGVWTVDRTVVSHSLEVDEDDAVFADARDVLLGAEPPRFTVVHVNTPDKKAHAHGVTSREYTMYIRGLDAKLEAFLASLPPTLSVLLTSDHGATDGGSHGSDTAVQRRSPFLAFGPALATHPRQAELDQLDVAATLAALTGVRAPTQGRGHVATEVLDLDDASAARLACAQLRNVRAFARAVIGREPEEGAVADACDTMPPSEALPRARAAARALDARIGHMRADSPRGFLPAALAALALLGGALLLGARAHAQALAVPVSVGALATALALAVTWGFELLPGLWPDRARAVGYALGNVPLLALLLRPRALLARVPPRAVEAGLVMPGLLLLTEPKTTQAEAFATLAVLALVVLFGRHRATPHAPREALVRHWPALVGVVALAAPGVLDDSFVPRAVADRAWASHATAALCLVGYALWRRSHASLTRAEGLTLAALGALGLAVRDAGPVTPALALWGLGAAALPAVAVRAARSAAPRRVPFAIPAAIVLVYALLSRDLEWPFLVAAMILAAHVADELARDLAMAHAKEAVTRAEGDRARAMLLTAAFAIAYVGRVGVQQGFHFLHMDWAAGAFRDPAVSTWRIGFGIGTKHALALAAILGSAGLALPPAARAWLWRALSLAALARVVVLALMLHVCRNSFWTPVWVIGELPNMLLTLLAAVTFLAIDEARAPAEADG
jgi:hypothetical protein